MVVKAVVFDLDGTIAAFNMDFRAVRAEVRSFLISAGLPASVLLTNESIFEMLKKTEIFVKNNYKPKRAIAEMREKALAIAERFELEAAKTTSLLPGAAETLKALKKMNLKIGLCTINGAKSTDYILRRFKITDYFDAVTPRDKVRYVKPNEEHLEVTLESLGVNPDETIVVGDASVDMKCAKELKVVAAGLPTGLTSAKELINSGANYIITSLADLPVLIEKINNTSENREQAAEGT
jgi:HAD superfamily hydrolase (TIGR01549 family)